MDGVWNLAGRALGPQPTPRPLQEILAKVKRLAERVKAEPEVQK